MTPVFKTKHLLVKALLCTSVIISQAVTAQTREKGPWWPNPLWGANDQAGGSNWITPEKVLQALSLVKSGKVFELGHPYERGMPMPGKRSFNLFIPSFPTYDPVGENKVVFNDEYVTSEIGQVGTQFDGPGHVGRLLKMADSTTTEVFYNGVQGKEMKSAYGLLKNGVENVKPIITRGVLIDIAGYKGIPSLAEDYEITLADVRNALAKQGIKERDIQPGDALLFNLGWWRHWPNAIMVTGKQPYANREVVNWIISLKPCMVGSDASLDKPDYILHEEVILKNGIFNLEYMNFESIQAEKQHIFLFVFTPLRFKGATGSPGRPLAIW